MTEFDMPPASAGFEARGGWLVNRLAVEFDLTAIQAAGIVGNLGYESAGFTKLQEVAPAIAGSRGGYGWAQWTGPRRRAFEALAAQANLSPASDEANFGFLLVELSGAYRGTILMLRKCASDADAVFSFGQTYERPGGTTATHLPGLNGRLKYARIALKGAAALELAPIDHRVNPPERRAVSIDMAIRVLQGALKSASFYEGLVDGDPGPLTLKALAVYRARR